MAHRETVEKTKREGFSITGDDLEKKREEVSRAIGRKFRQDEAALFVGVSIPTYVLAETYSVIRGQTRAKVVAWIDRDLASIVRAIKRTERRER